MALRKELSLWNGKCKTFIECIYSKYSVDRNFVESLIQFIENKQYQKGSSWLIKKWLESGNRLSLNHTNRLFDSLHDIDCWETVLHILQSIPFMIIPQTRQSKAYIFLRIMLSHSNKFVRAWAYNGFNELAKQYPKFSTENLEYINMAQSDEAPSVKARLRLIIKEMKK